jgi:hypothetical protein
MRLILQWHVKPFGRQTFSRGSKLPQKQGASKLAHSKANKLHLRQACN